MNSEYARRGNLPSPRNAAAASASRRDHPSFMFMFGVYSRRGNVCAMAARRFRIDWTGAEDALSAVEPTMAEIRDHAAALAVAYSDPHNAPMMGHAEPFDVDD